MGVELGSQLTVFQLGGCLCEHLFEIENTLPTAIPVENSSLSADRI